MTKVAAVVCGLALLIDTTAEAVDVVSCDQQIGAGEVGELVADLACLSTDFGVRLAQRATLRLNGFEIQANGVIAVWCEDRKCSVEGPGRIVGGEIGINLQARRAHLKIHDVTLEGNDAGILGGVGGTASDRNSVVDATGVVVRGSAFVGLNAGLVRADGLVLENNGVDGARVRALRGTDVTAVGNGQHGIDALRYATVRALTATDNGGAGVHVDGRVKLRDSSVVGNTTVDIDATRGRLRDTVCGTSTLGLCAND